MSRASHLLLILRAKQGAAASPLAGHLPCAAFPSSFLSADALCGFSLCARSPFGNRRVSDSGLSADIGIGTLIGETNAGSLVWPQGAEHMPFDFKDANEVQAPQVVARDMAHD